MRLRTLPVTALAALVVLTACGEQEPEIDVDPAVEVDEDEEEPDATDETTEDADTSSEEATDGPDASEAGEDEAAADEDTDTSSAGTDTTDDGPSPDPAALEDPCAGHEDREMELFIELHAPVDDQVATDTVRIVGCSNVPEANIVWNLLDGDGVLLDEGFTTATCGTGCVGAFDDEVPLDAAAGEPVAYLQVFTPNLADDGPDQLELVERIVVIG